MMTQLESARRNIATAAMKKIARQESLSIRFLLRQLKQGRAVIPLNNRHRLLRPCGIGKGLRTKINANIGTSTDKSKISYELDKLDTAIKYGADTVMDLSVGGDIPKMRRLILKRSVVPVGTVPIYEIAVGAGRDKGDMLKFGRDEVLDALESQAKEGVDFFTIHCGITRKNMALLERKQRLMGVVSRGGAIIASWMKRHKEENPFYAHFDLILDIAHKYDVTLSLGDGLRPGSVLDATDKPQLSELKNLGEFVLHARRKGVQAIVEGPGHVPLQQIGKNVELEKLLCHQAPFYVLGPLVTDVAAGYDHITASIGGALAASRGADFLCYVTASEHLRHPSLEDVREGVIASRIAAHAGDIAKGIKSALKWDRRMSIARYRRDWKSQLNLAIDPDKAKSYRLSSRPHLSDVCTMCGEYCSIKLMEKCMRA